MEFKYKGTSPVKKNSNPNPSCSNCIHCHDFSEQMRCGVDLCFYFKTNETHCNERYFEILKHRKVYVSFCFGVFKGFKFNYTPSGLGMVFESDSNDKEIINNIIKNKDIMNHAKKEIINNLNINKNIIVTPILFAQRINDGPWIKICNELEEERSAAEFDNLKKNNP